MSRRTVKSEFPMAPAKRLSVSLVTLILCTTVVQSCGKTASSNVMHLKSATTGEKDLGIKSGYAFAITKTFSDLNGKMATASAYNVYLANYDLDSKNFAMSMDRPLTGDDQVRVVFNLIGDEGTNDKSPPKAGLYSAKADKFMKSESVGLVARRNGADVKSWMDRTALTGQVNVTSATSDEINGDVDLTSGDVSIKGSFSAKILKRK